MPARTVLGNLTSPLQPLHSPRPLPRPGTQTVDAIRGMEVATYVLQDDNLYMRLICSTIAETEERFVVESDLKVVCGFRGKRGHRLWRRMRVSEGARVREEVVEEVVQGGWVGGWVGGWRVDCAAWGHGGGVGARQGAFIGAGRRVEGWLWSSRRVPSSLSTGCLSSRACTVPAQHRRDGLLVICPMPG